MERREIGKTKKAIQDNFVKFLKRLQTIADTWYIYNDIWYPSERTDKTRPGYHCARCPLTSGICTNDQYRSRPLKDVINDIDVAADKSKGQVASYVQDKTGIWVQFGTAQALVAYYMYPDTDITSYEAALYRGNTFDQLFNTKGMTPIPHDTLMAIKKGEVLEITRDNVVMTRLVRSMFKLRGKSERSNTDVDYKAWYTFRVSLKEDEDGIPLIEFIVVVDYSFIMTSHTYFVIPFNKPKSIEEATTMVSSLVSTDMGLFDESDADDGYSVDE